MNTAREAALDIELANLRRALNYFVMTKRALPVDLKELMNVVDVMNSVKLDGVDYNVLFQGEQYNLLIAASYLGSMITDEDGFPTDSFGNTYSYDPSTGRIWSSTSGYQHW